MGTGKKKLVDVSESKLMMEKNTKLVTCPSCKGNGKSCKLCGGMGEVSAQKARNFSS